MKKQISQLSFFILSISLSIILSGCGNLTRNKAKTIIIEKMKSDKYCKSIVLTYDISPFNGKIEGGYDLETDKLLEKSGYITIDSNNYNITLLPKIQPFVYIDSGITSAVWISVATLSNVEITGISGEDNYRRVEYIRYYSLNEVGRAISYSKDLTFEGSISFTKYDDGWRIQN